ncbi:hypothetical protein SAY87_016734 [Trapa incisa]|uniref:Uncharacterized protein n=1 Tax=Trapa incisa TaxID=236973 RepID=A0AAN7L1R1_9MYRT|nr:hypothetical protein SAY87_016734 [Trapa incisa]
MAMAPTPHPCLLALLSFLFIASSSLSPTAPSPAEPQPDVDPTVYDILPTFGLPGGLLPDSVASYSISADGRFAVFLKGPCYVQFEYLIYYDDRITGKISYGSITELEGIQVQRFFIWFDVNEIRVDLPPSDSIYFQVGFINRKLDVGQFMTVHSCQDRVSGPCRKPWNRILELPSPMVGEAPILKEE